MAIQCLTQQNMLICFTIRKLKWWPSFFLDQPVWIVPSLYKIFFWKQASIMRVIIDTDDIFYDFYTFSLLILLTVLFFRYDKIKTWLLIKIWQNKYRKEEVKISDPKRVPRRKTSVIIPVTNGEEATHSPKNTGLFCEFFFSLHNINLNCREDKNPCKVSTSCPE
jgi:hypothetical protein